MKRFAEGGETAQVMGMIRDRAWITDKIFDQVQKAYQGAQELKQKAGKRLTPKSPSTKVVLASTEKTPFGDQWATTGHPREYECKHDQLAGLPSALCDDIPGRSHVFPSYRN